MPQFGMNPRFPMEARRKPESGDEWMQRIFTEHRIRKTASLDGIWELIPRDGSGRAFPAGVPGVWDRIPALTRFRGIADYRRNVRVSREGPVLLRFGGVSHTARVFWDEEPVGQHYNAYTGFEILLHDVSAGEHALRVEVDDRYTEQSALHVPNDYMTYGGITRPAEIHELPGAWVERMAFYAEEKGTDAFEAHVRVLVRMLTPLSGLSLEISLAGVTRRESVSGTAGERVSVDFSFLVSGIRRWDLSRGNLYDLTAVLFQDGTALDDLTDRVGFRSVRLQGEEILLNGKKVKIRGFNRHEDHGLFGCALPAEAMLQDLQYLLDLGANSVRTCHYPNDPRFLDLCDELGILVWEENHARALPEQVFHSGLFAAQCEACNEEMITQHGNHPAIYVWGLLNECESETAFGRGVYEKQIAQLRALDPTRPVSFASCRAFTDICLDLVDICAFNIYPGWYTEEKPGEYAKKLFAWMDESGAAGKPILITEVGAGAVAGFHDPLGRAKWSEERQSDILEEQLTDLLASPRASGVYVWQFADVRVSEEWAMRRPKTVNNKGILTMDRAPKMSYATVRRIFHAFADAAEKESS